MSIVLFGTLSDVRVGSSSTGLRCFIRLTILRLSVESSALFTPKDEQPDRIYRFFSRAYSFALMPSSPGGSLDESEFTTYACASVSSLYLYITLNAEDILYESRILTVHSHFYYDATLYNLSSRCKYKYVYALNRGRRAKPE